MRASLVEAPAWREVLRLTSAPTGTITMTFAFDILAAFALLASSIVGSSEGAPLVGAIAELGSFAAAGAGDGNSAAANSRVTGGIVGSSPPGAVAPAPSTPAESPQDSARAVAAREGPLALSKLERARMG